MGIREDNVANLVASLAFSPTMMESHFMRDEFHDEYFSEIWRSAEHRRAEDIYFWFARFFARQPLFARQPRLELPGPGLLRLHRRIVAVLYRLLKMPHAVSRTTKSGHQRS
jgi:hypothetical protein